MTTELMATNTGSVMSVMDVTEQVQQIQSLMKSVMKEGEHYGVIPGCGNKPTLLQPGAQKLALTFGFAAKYDIEKTNLQGTHREYESTCTLVHRQSGNLVGEGVGVCSTTEGKYRYRSENTNMPVPREYWDTKDISLLGGPGHHPRKVQGKWMIFHRVDHDNPADYWNTVKKMSKKRAFVDAVLTATAASDIFTQDIEDMTEVLAKERTREAEKPKEQIIETVQQEEPIEQVQASKSVAANPVHEKKPDMKWQHEDTFLVQEVFEVAQKDDEGNRKEGGWVIYVIKGNNDRNYSTFDENIRDAALEMVGDKRNITVGYDEVKGKRRIVEWGIIPF